MFNVPVLQKSACMHCRVQPLLAEMIWITGHVGALMAKRGDGVHILDPDTSRK